MTTEHAIPIGDEEIAAVHHPADTDRWLLFCHGFLGDKTGSYEARSERVVEEGYNAVRFDFRGSGESDRAFVESTLSSRISDLRAVVDYFDPLQYALFGSSFGAKVAFHAATADISPETIVARSPVTYNRSFDAYRHTVETEGSLRFDDDHAIDDRFFDDFERYPFDAVAETLDIPVAIFHGAADESVPIADSFEAAAALDTDVCLERFAGEDHRFSPPAERRLRRRTLEWMDGL